MDCLKAVQAYVDKAITSTPGIKVLLLDSDTVRRRRLLSPSREPRGPS